MSLFTGGAERIFNFIVTAGGTGQPMLAGQCSWKRCIRTFQNRLAAREHWPANGTLSSATRLLKSTTITINGTRGIEYGEVTSGGIEWEKIDPKTLESGLAPGLFFAGEILDLTGRCGGFNLQAAFSTGYLAGSSAAQKALT